MRVTDTTHQRATPVSVWKITKPMSANQFLEFIEWLERIRNKANDK